ncbi:Lactoylglutathione lyase [Klebsiella pneumoniae]|uniref:Lactoylglutathione lyase n=1 Tax=Klebsiella pneumoniae TaxID=573 RepID=A0A2X1QY97_KLEPN|nr:Lactoylglutathione lyase [Klebsiella pneumoniae]
MADVITARLAERHYHPGYYAAFVLDPQGNNIEAVYHGKAERSAGVCCDQLHAVSGRKSHFLTCAIPIINVGVIISLMNNSYP